MWHAGFSLRYASSFFGEHRLQLWWVGSTVEVLLLSCSEAPGVLVPRQGIEPLFPAFRGRFLTVGTPRKSPVAILNEIVFLNLFSF